MGKKLFSLKSIFSLTTALGSRRGQLPACFLLWGSDCPNQNIQEEHGAACAPHQHIPQQSSCFTPSSLNYWDLGVHGGRVEQRGLKSMLNILDRVSVM